MTVTGIGKRNRNKNKVKRKIAVWLLTVLMVCAAAGCGTPGGGDGLADGAAGSDGSGDIAGGTDASGETTGGQTAMGRYVEEEIELPTELSRPLFMGMMDDGSIVIVDAYQGFLVSEDKGTTWNENTPDWFQAYMGDNADRYISSFVMSPGRTAAITYVETDEVNASPDAYHPDIVFITPDGVETPGDINLSEEEGYFRQVVASDDGRFFALTHMSVYQVNPEDGTGVKVLTTEDSSYMWAKDDLLYIDSDWEGVRAPFVYDLDLGEYVEDEVLLDFVSENYSGRNYNGLDYGSMMLLPAADRSVYIIGQKGIHRHVLGGNMVEQIVDGGLSLLGNPRYASTVATLQPEENVFLTLCANYKLVRFTYDPDMPSVPEKMLTVYSLKENDDIRQAIAYYQTKHPDIFVSYEVAMSGGSAVTRDDALKKLNTQIMAGEGPDLIVLDDMPVDSYVAKGMLLDLTDYLTQYSATEPLFINMTDAMKIDGKVYAAPATVSLPVLVAGEEYAANMTDMSGVADMIEKLRTEHTGDYVIGVCGEKHIMKRFAAASAPAWVREDGSLDLDEIGSYLEQCKRIYDAQKDSLSADMIQSSTSRMERMAEYENEDAFMLNWGAYLDVIDYITGEMHVLTGWVTNSYEYEQLLSIDKAAGCEDTWVVPMQGKCSNIFMPHTLLGINAMSAQTEEAKGFMNVFLSAEVQSNYSGFPYNQNAFDIQFTPKADILGENNEYGGWVTTDADGNMIEFDIYFPTDEQLAAFKKQMGSADTAYIPDRVVEDAVYTAGGTYLRGESGSLERVLNEIERSLAIYMAE